ncbi:hypothetical protein Gorai_022958 [Gossypium raimondii]|uniref:RNase H type-1 domain-containing protein n=1 Tax=Gossypium raimondii TaxID=29730 RepID=A0A7J8NUZ7_GOSRA|nr:hypothetical protein [Gossypium raimondii]
MDATIQEGRVGLGVIARDNEGFMLGRGCLKETMMNSAWAELMATEELIMAKSLNLKKVNFEFDNVSIVNKLNSNGRDLTFMAQCAKEICTKLKSFEATVITWAPKSYNRLADFICNFVLNKNCIWNFDVNDVNYPREIQEIFIQEAINEF